MDTDTTTETTTDETTETTGSEATGQQDAGTEQRTVGLEEHQREVDRYREQFGQEKRRATEAERLLTDAQKRLKAIEDERKPEIERLTEKAAQAEILAAKVTEHEATIESLSTALAAEVDRQRKGLPEEIRSLLPEGLSPVDQLAWLGKAAKVKASSNGLPPSGGRAPGAGGKPEGPTEQERQAIAIGYARKW